MSIEDTPSPNDLELQVFGNLPNKGLAETQFKELMGHYAQAVDCGDSREIEALELQLSELTTVHAGLRALIAENHLDRN